MSASRIPRAADLMTRKLLTVRPDQSVLAAMRLLVDNSISGAPVLDSSGKLCGILSEFDCLRVLASGHFDDDAHGEADRVADVMTGQVETIPPDLDLFSIVHRFLRRKIRRLPVVDDGRLVGMVSRRDVLRGVETMRQQPRPAQHRPKGLYLSASDPDGDEIDSLLD